MDRDQGNQGGRGSNLSDEDRSRGGQTSADEQDRDEQGQFTGQGNRGGQGGNQGGGSNQGGGGSNR